jgi:hypothetical protein
MRKYTHKFCNLPIQTINHVQKQCYETTTKVNDELDKKFLAQDVMDALGVVACEVTFPIYMAILKRFIFNL